MSDERCDILLFQVGARVFASVVYDAVRVGNVRDVAAGALVVETALGSPVERERGIVIAGDDANELCLVIDQVLGIRSVHESDVLALPAFAAACLASGAVTGFVLVDEAPVLLVDLPTLVRERPGATPGQRAA